MKDSHLTLRLPADLARALARWARSRRVPKSQLVREAVTRLLEDAHAREAMARAGQRLVDGRGASRVVTELMAAVPLPL
ncbi:MAG: CopG family transcriptional regulator, partial [Gemmatimonadota bacterium]